MLADYIATLNTRRFQDLNALLTKYGFNLADFVRQNASECGCRHIEKYEKHQNTFIALEGCVEEPKSLPLYGIFWERRGSDEQKDI